MTACRVYALRVWRWLIEGPRLVVERDGLRRDVRRLVVERDAALADRAELAEDVERLARDLELERAAGARRLQAARAAARAAEVAAERVRVEREVEVVRRIVDGPPRT